MSVNLNNLYVNSKLINDEYILNKDLYIVGNGEITGNNTVIKGIFKLNVNNNKVVFRNITFDNINRIIINNANVEFESCAFKNIFAVGVESKNSNLIFNNCKIDKIGEFLTEQETTYLGGLCYCEGGTLKVNGCDIKNTYGQGALRATNCENVEIENNKIYDTAYRAVSIYNWQGVDTIGFIKHNEIYNCGIINKHNTGVGCNGIYGSGTDKLSIEVSNNKIRDVYENGIEGAFLEVGFNTIENTGLNIETHPTPSTEGIYCWHNVHDNIIINPHRYGIYLYDENNIQGLNIKNNKIIKGDNTVVDEAICLNSLKFVNGNVIENNSATGFKKCVQLYAKTGIYNNYLENNIIGNEDEEVENNEEKIVIKDIKEITEIVIDSEGIAIYKNEKVIKLTKEQIKNIFDI